MAVMLGQIAFTVMLSRAAMSRYERVNPTMPLDGGKKPSYLTEDHDLLFGGCV